ncbi:MAG TPA: APC family permease [Candidatus Acidoferrum sp.]|jgi:amino acid transporter|nr:APC family permease [Candidatus Acidoferrum sp.]
MSSGKMSDTVGGVVVEPALVENHLRPGSLKFPSILVQGVTHIAPAIGLVLSIQYIALQAGTAAPLAFLVAFLIILMLGISLTQLAKHNPSAGGYYTYILRTIHPKAGFLTAWVYFLYDPASTAINLAFMGYFLQNTLKAEMGVLFPWWVFFVPAALLVTLLTYCGIELSATTMVWLTVVEVAILAALSIMGVLHPGPGGVRLPAHTLAAVPAQGRFYLAVVFAIFCFTGFESVAPLAEETEDPKRNLPRSIVYSIVLTGIFFTFCSWAVLTGWGVANPSGFAQSVENPVLILAHRLWGRAWILVFVAVFNSIMAASIACTNAATRVFFAMGRARSLPAFLGKIHPEFKTPVNAIWLQTALTLAVGLGMGFWIGPDQEYYFLGVSMTLGLIFVYAAGNIGVMLDYGWRRRDQLHPILHVAFPLLSTLALLWAGYFSVVPLPPPPVRYAPYLAGVWLLAGAFLAFRPHRSERL